MSLVLIYMSGFIEYAQIAFTLLLLYYFIKFFMVAPPTKQEREAELAQRRQLASEWLERARENSQAVKTLKNRKDRLRPAQSYLLHAIQAGDALIHELEHAQREEAAHKAKVKKKSLVNYLTAAKRALRTAKRHEEGEPREKIEGIYTYIDLAYTKAQEITIPDSHDAQWEAQVAVCKQLLLGDQGIIPLCELQLEAIDHLIHSSRAEHLQRLANQRLQDQVRDQQDDTPLRRPTPSPEQDQRRQRHPEWKRRYSNLRHIASHAVRRRRN